MKYIHAPLILAYLFMITTKGTNHKKLKVNKVIDLLFCHILCVHNDIEYTDFFTQ